MSLKLNNLKKKISTLTTLDILLLIFLLFTSVFYIWLIDNPLKYFYLLLIYGSIIVIKKLLMVEPVLHSDLNSDSKLDIELKNVAKLDIDSDSVEDISNKFLSHRQFKICKKKFRSQPYFGLNLSFPVIIMSLILSFNINSTILAYLRSFLTLAVILSLPGYVFFAFNKNLRESLSNLEFFLFIVLFNYIFAGILWLIILLFKFNHQSHIFLCFYFILAVGNIIIHSNSKIANLKFEVPPSFSTRKDKYGLLIIGLFFLFSHILTIPATNYSYIDIQRHYSYAVLLGRDIGLYLNLNWGNFLAHLFESAFVYSSNSNMEIIQVCLVFITFLYPFFFYSFVQRFFNKNDSRLPIFATMIYMLGSLGGIGWLYYVKTKIAYSLGQSLLYNNIINTVFYQTFKTNSYGFLPSYFKPIMVSMFIFFFLLQLLRNFKLSQRNFLWIFSLILAAMYSIHVVEATIFTFFIGIWGFFYKSQRYRINDSLIAAFFGTLIALISFFGLNLARHKVPSFYFAILGLNLLILIFTLYFRSKRFSLKDRTLKNAQNTKKNTLSTRNIKNQNNEDFIFFGPKFQNKIVNVFPVVGIIFLTIAILTWITLWDSYDISYFILNPYRQIPWFFQGLRLGFIGLGGLYYLFLRVKSKKSIRDYNFLILFSIYSFIVGRIITFSNIFIFPQSPVYWETRFEVFIIIPYTILISLFILEKFDHYFRNENKNLQFYKLKNKFKEIRQSANGIFILLLIFFSNFTTVLLNYEVRWATSAPNRSMLASDEWSDTNEGIEFLSQLLDKKPASAILTISSDTFGLINIAGPANLLLLKKESYTSENPTSFLLEVFKAHYWRDSFTYPYVFLYVSSDDYDVLKDIYNSFLGTIIDTFPMVFSNNETRIYDISHLSYPTSESETALIYPTDDISQIDTNANNLLRNDSLEMEHIITSLLSQGSGNVSLAFDGENFDHFSNLILSYDIPNQTTSSIIDFNKFKKNSVWKMYNSTSIGINASFFIERKSNITSYQEVSAFNLTFIINWTHFSNSSQSQLKFRFNQDLKLDFSEIIFNFSADGKVFCYYWDEFGENIYHFPNYGILKSNIPGIFIFSAQFAKNNYNFFVNDEKILNISGNYPTTYLGFQYLNNIGENHVSINLTQNSCTNYLSNLRPKEDYYQSAENGQNVAIFNTNGYQNIAEDFFTINSSIPGNYLSFNQVQFDQIANATKSRIPTFSIPNVDIPPLQINNDTISVIANYSNGLETIPFICKKTVGKGQLFYVNIFPLTSFFIDHDLIGPDIYSSSLTCLASLFSNNTFTDLLKNLFNISSFNRSLGYKNIAQNMPIDHILLLNTLISAKNFIISTQEARNIDKIEVTFQNSSIQVFPNIYQLRICHSGEVIFHLLDAICLNDEDSFYPTLVQNQTFWVDFNQERNEILVKSGNMTYILENISQITFYLLDEMAISLRDVKIQASYAKIFYLIEPLVFKNYYTAFTNTYMEFTSSLPNGLNFSITNLGNNLAIYNSSFEITQPINRDFYYNELKSIPIALLWLAVESILYIIFLKWKKKQKESNLDNLVKQTANSTK